MLTSKYPLIRVPYSTKREVDVDARNTKTNANQLFRLLMASIYPDDEIWAASNADKFFNKCSDEVHAVIGNFLFKLF